MGVNMRMGTQGERPPEQRPFQFGLKHLLALPVVVAGFFALAAWLGVGPAVWLLLASLSALGMCFRRTRAVGCTMGLLLLAHLCLLPMRSTGRGAARRAVCSNNLKQIVLALHNYHDVHGCFPPAYIADENGRPMHSWRVLILPYLENPDFYNQYRFDERWDGPNNRKLAKIRMAVFNCPSDHEEPSTMTSYVVVVGPDTAWPGSKPTNLDDFADGPSNTILVVEVKNSGIHWMEPRDLHVVQMAPGVNPKAGQGVSSNHSGGANVAIVDGSVEFLPEDTSADVLRALLTIDSGEKVDWDSVWP
jgi:prepilin-type processing-associated H-X9-DG protein